MCTSPSLRRFLAECRLPLLYCLGLGLIVYAVAGDRYGYMGDELYFMEAGRHLDLGYLDFPPLVAWVAALVRVTLGESLYALRFLPFVCGTLVSMVAVAITHSIGGGRLAVWLTAIVVSAAPVFVSFHSVLTMNAFDQLWWALVLLAFVHYLRSADGRHLLWIGVVLGLGAVTKLSIALLAMALLVVLVAFRPAALKDRHLYAGAAVALLVASPFVYWEVANGLPFLEFADAYRAVAQESFIMDSFLASQLLTMNPFNVVIWLPGVLELLFGRGGRWRPLGVLVLVVAGLSWLLGVRFYFLAPTYLPAVAAGAVLWERLLVPRRRIAAAALVGLALGTAATGLPSGAPIVPAAVIEKRFRTFERTVLGEDLGPGALGRFFPHFAEMHGWPELAALTASVYRQHRAEVEDLHIVTAHFGQASAINFFARGQGLPHACSGHMQYYLWCRDEDLPAALALGFDREELARLFAEVRPLARLECRFCTRRERELEIVLVRGPLVPRDEMWQALRRLYLF